jgi:hypothetical protein
LVEVLELLPAASQRELPYAMAFAVTGSVPPDHVRPSVLPAYLPSPTATNDVPSLANAVTGNCGEFELPRSVQFVPSVDAVV